ncbi:TetR/AcrR family transcriptional regulator [Desulfovibrio aminophilus]|nr:TetR/AcrR family transcriptional regulator [Desulfovibrio aminophilus]MCM0754588.1 TetR/AcrR family transcriptional regulator [Desulfovibrio aminophilus]
MTRNAETNQRMRDERRERILAEALRLFAARGLAAVTAGEIAAATGTSKGLLYHYFRSKDEIFTSLIREAFARMNEAARGLEALDLPPREKIALALGRLLRGLEQDERFALHVLLIAQAGLSQAIPEEARAVLREESFAPYGVVERILRAGQEDGSIRSGDDPRDLALVFWTTVKGLALHRAAHGSDFRAPDPRILLRMFWND